MVTGFPRFGAFNELQKWVQLARTNLTDTKKPAEAGFCEGREITWRQRRQRRQQALPKRLLQGQRLRQQGAVAAAGAAGAAFLLLAMPKPTARPTASTITATKTAQTTG
jgi:hypothetical protein